MPSFLLIVAIALVVTGCHTEGARSSTSSSAATGTNARTVGRQPIIALPVHSSEWTNRPCIYISREVKSSGAYSWSSGMTLTDAIASAGGFTEVAGRSHIQVFHKDHKVPAIYDYDRILKHKAEDPVLEPYDYILVDGWPLY